MLWVRKIRSWISSRLNICDLIILILQLYGASVITVTSPFLLRHLFLPSLVEYTAPLNFNFETCREQLAGVCSFPTAVVDFSADNIRLSPGEYYEVGAEIILSESTINANIGIFQAVVELMNKGNITKTFRRSFFLNKDHSLIYRAYKIWWNLTCKTIFFPMYLFGLLSVADDRKMEISFTDSLTDKDIANTVLFYVQLQNRFIEVVSAKLLLRVRFGLLRIFLYDYPIISSLLIAGFTYFMCFMGIVLYWTVQIYFRVTDANVTGELPGSSSRQEELQTFVTKNDTLESSWENSGMSDLNEVQNSLIRRRNRDKIKQ